MPIKGSPPSLINVPTGCAFHPRCAYAGLNERPQRDRAARAAATPAPGHLVRLPPVAASERRARSGPNEIKPRL